MDFGFQQFQVAAPQFAGHKPADYSVPNPQKQQSNPYFRFSVHSVLPYCVFESASLRRDCPTSCSTKLRRREPYIIRRITYFVKAQPREGELISPFHISPFSCQPSEPTGLGTGAQGMKRGSRDRPLFRRSSHHVGPIQDDQPRWSLLLRTTFSSLVSSSSSRSFALRLTSNIFQKQRKCADFQHGKEKLHHLGHPGKAGLAGS